MIYVEVWTDDKNHLFIVYDTDSTVLLVTDNGDLLEHKYPRAIFLDDFQVSKEYYADYEQLKRNMEEMPSEV